MSSNPQRYERIRSELETQGNKQMLVHGESRHLDNVQPHRNQAKELPEQRGIV
jgi:hypothetical protein